jgi:hypothetical protein
MTASIGVGLREAFRHPKLVWLLWAWYGLLALVPALPAWSWWNGVLGYSPDAASVLERFDLGVFLDVTAGKGINGLGLLAGAAAAAGLIALLSSAFAFGGILEVLASHDDRRPFMHRFFRGGGHFFWRFLRLAIIAGVCLVLAIGVVAAIQRGLVSAAGDSEWEPAGYLAGLAGVAAFLAVAGFFLLALDYARIRVSRDDSRGMLKAYALGLGFVLGRLFSVYGIAIVIVVVEVILVAGYLAYETNAPAAGTWGAIAVLIAIQQVVVFGRVFFRVALVGAERHFHVTTMPQPAPAPASLAEVPAAPEADGPLVPTAPSAVEGSQTPT